MTMTAQGEQGTQADNRGERPLMRGWLHVGACAAWLIGGPFLIAAGPAVGPTTALAVYVAGMVALFGTSAAFHRVRWSAPAWRRMRRADHSAIFVGIAGTSTAVAVLALHGWAEILLLALVWGGAIVGILLRQVWLDAPQWVVAVPYVVVGWCPLVVVPQLVHGLGWLGFSLTIVAGLAYTAGALVYRAEAARPLAPRVRLPRALPRLHAGGRGVVRRRGGVHRPSPGLTRRQHVSRWRRRRAAGPAPRRPGPARPTGPRRCARPARAHVTRDPRPRRRT